MAQTSVERLRDFLAQLPPQAQALLMREFERAIERGDDATVANFVLGQLRQIVRVPSDNERPRTADPARLVFQPLEPFLVENNPVVRPGQIRRSSLQPVWTWLTRDAVPDQAREFATAVANVQDQNPTGSSASPAIDSAVRAFQTAAAEAIANLTSPTQSRSDTQRALGRVGAPSVAEDIVPIGAVLQAREALESFGAKVPDYIRAFGEAQVAAVNEGLSAAALQSPEVLPFALSLVMQRLSSPWQIIRIAISTAGTDDEFRVAATPYGVAVSMAIHDLSRVTSELRSDIKRGQLDSISHHLKTVHDGIRGLRTELDIRSDSTWGRQLAAIRVDISSTLQSEIDRVPGRVRRLLRQRPDKDISAASRIDATEVDETEALIEFVATCRTYASELAINEVTLRTFSDLQHYVESSTEGLVAALRTTDGRVRDFRKLQVEAAIRFCTILFGQDYATLMTRAADHAAAERKASRAG